MLKSMEGKERKSYVRGEMQDTTTKIVKTPEESKTTSLLPNKIPKVIKEEEGTPIPQMYSEYKSLPTLDKWAVGMVDHIMFENLPDATGHYDRVRDILKKARKDKPESGK